jgi:hypothetical protein
MSTSVIFNRSWSSRIRVRIDRVVWGSKALVVSSQNGISGFTARVRAMATRCFCPPESSYKRTWRLSCILTNSKSSSTHFSICFLAPPNLQGITDITHYIPGISYPFSTFWAENPFFVRYPPVHCRSTPPWYQGLIHHPSSKVRSNKQDTPVIMELAFKIEDIKNHINPIGIFNYMILYQYIKNKKNRHRLSVFCTTRVIPNTPHQAIRWA